MSLIKCPFCDKEYSSHLQECPSCGLTQEEAQLYSAKRNRFLKVYIPIILALVVAGIVIYNSGSNTACEEEEDPFANIEYYPCDATPDDFLGLWYAESDCSPIQKLFITTETAQVLRMSDIDAGETVFTQRKYYWDFLDDEGYLYIHDGESIKYIVGMYFDEDHEVFLTFIENDGPRFEYKFYE